MIVNQSISEIEKRWLIKTDNKIVGPYSLEQLEDLLLKRQIALIDEIRDMDHRWLYIREVPELKELVEMVRKELESKSEQTRTLQTKLQGSENSQLSQTVEVSILQKTPTQFSEVSTEIILESSDVKETEDPVLKTDSKKLNKSQFVMSSDPRTLSRVEKINKKLLIQIAGGLGVVILFYFAFVFYKQNQKNEYEKNLLIQLKKYTFQGLDKKAIDIYQKLPENLQDQVIPEMLALMPQMDHAGLIRTDEEIKKMQNSGRLTTEQKSKIELIRFNQKLSAGDIKGAQNHLIQAKDADPRSVQVLENEALFSYILKEYRKSKNSYEELFKNENKGRFLLGIALNEIQMDISENTALMEMIDRYTSTRVDFKKELLLIQIYLASKMNNQVALSNALKEFHQTPVNLNYYFRLPHFVSSKIYDWKQIVFLLPLLKNAVTPKDYTLLELNSLVQLNEMMATQKLFNQSENMLSKYEKVNFLIQFQFVQNNFQNVITLEKSNPDVDLSLASHYYLYASKLKLNDLQTGKHFEALQRDKNILSLWSQLNKLDRSQPGAIKLFLDSYFGTYEDFIPFIEAKGSLE